MGDPSGSPVSRTADTLSTPTRPSRTARPRGTSRTHNGTGVTVSRPVAVALDIAGDRINGCALGRTTSDSWKHAYLPVEHPVTVESHDRITLALTRQTTDEASNPVAFPTPALGTVTV
jgi:hypothetical protein